MRHFPKFIASFLALIAFALSAAPARAAIKPVLILDMPGQGRESYRVSGFHWDPSQIVVDGVEHERTDEITINLPNVNPSQENGLISGYLYPTVVLAGPSNTPGTLVVFTFEEANLTFSRDDLGGTVTLQFAKVTIEYHRPSSDSSSTSGSDTTDDQ